MKISLCQRAERPLYIPVFLLREMPDFIFSTNVSLRHNDFYAVMEGSREKSRLFRNDNKFSLSVSLIMSITPGDRYTRNFSLA